MPKKWIGYKEALQRAVAMYEGVSLTKARQIISTNVREIKALNRKLGKDLQRSPYRQFEQSYFGGHQIQDFETTVYERFSAFSQKYGSNTIEFKYRNKTYNMTLDEVVTAYAQGEVTYTFVRNALRVFEDTNAEYIKGGYHRH